MSTTFTGPIRIGTRQTTSNDGTISTSNYGAAVCSRQVAIVGGAAATIVIPAGSIVQPHMSAGRAAALAPAYLRTPPGVCQRAAMRPHNHTHI